MKSAAAQGIIDENLMGNEDVVIVKDEEDLEALVKTAKDKKEIAA